MGAGLGRCIVLGLRPTTDVIDYFKDDTCKYLVSKGRVDLIDDHLDPEYKFRERPGEEEQTEEITQ